MGAFDWGLNSQLIDYESDNLLTALGPPSIE